MDRIRNAERNSPAPRVIDAQNAEPQVLGIGGALLLLLGGFFAWRELALANEVLMLAGAMGASALAWYAAKKRLTLVAPVVLTIATLSAGAWYAMTKEPLLIVAMGVTFVASVLATVHARKAFPRETFQVHQTLSWLGMALNGLVTTFGAYFLVFNASETGLHDFVARRAVLTLSWLLAGTALVILGRRKKATEMRDAGFLLLAASMGKLLMYDMAHTDGIVRVGTLLIGGAVLMGASRVVGLINRGKAVSS